jgi:hypothetical protein
MRRLCLVCLAHHEPCVSVVDTSVCTQKELLAEAPEGRINTMRRASCLPIGHESCVHVSAVLRVLTDGVYVQEELPAGVTSC